MTVSFLCLRKILSLFIKIIFFLKFYIDFQKMLCYNQKYVKNYQKNNREGASNKDVCFRKGGQYYL